MKMKDFKPVHFNWHAEGEVTLITLRDECFGLSALLLYEAAGVGSGHSVVT